MTMAVAVTLLSLRLLQQLLHSLHSAPYPTSLLPLRRLLLSRVHLSETRHRIFTNLPLTRVSLSHTTLQLLVEIARRRILALRVACTMAVALCLTQRVIYPPCSDSTEPRESPSRTPHRGPSAASNASSRGHAYSREYLESCARAIPHRNGSNAHGPLHPASLNR